MSYAVRIGDNYLELRPEQNIPVTLKVADLGDLSGRFVSYTNTFNVPKSWNNQKTFGHPENIHSNSNLPYELSSAKVYIKGLEVLSGVTFFQDSGSEYKVEIFDNTKDFFDAIDGLSLQDLDFNDSPITWNDTYIDSRRAATSDIVTPMIDYGQLNVADPVDISIGDVYLPSIYYKTVLETIFSNAGFSMAGDVLTDEKYTKMILAYSKDTWPGSSFTRDQIMPDIYQSEFVKHFLITFALLPVQLNGVITFYKYEDIIQNKVDAVDWTTKRVSTNTDKIDFNNSNYGQSSMFLYSDGLPRNEYGNLEVEDEKLDAIKLIYEAPFVQRVTDIYSVLDGAEFILGATLMEPIWSAPPASYPPATEFENEPEPLILLVRDKFASEPDVQYDGNYRSDYLVGYYENINPLSETFYDTLKWEDGELPSESILGKYYSSIQEAIRKPKRVQYIYDLSLMDIVNFKPYNLVFDNGSYYIVNEISNFLEGKVTKVILSRVL